MAESPASKARRLISGGLFPVDENPQIIIPVRDSVTCKHCQSEVSKQETICPSCSRCVHCGDIHYHPVGPCLIK
jgi:hypothetical protein